MRFDPSLELVKDRTNRQFALERTEGSLGLCQLDVFSSIDPRHYHRSDWFAADTLLRASPAKCGGLARPPIRIEAPRRSVLPPSRTDRRPADDVVESFLSVARSCCDLSVFVRRLACGVSLEHSPSVSRTDSESLSPFPFEPPCGKARRFPLLLACLPVSHQPAGALVPSRLPAVLAQIP